ncbi:MAG: NAD(P)H-dependent oxidoreductase [Firmicutes bacterium]|nr:NAD(P)H-dependent oxidoreductase [Candidatus Fermentithermobacillaceae bacterium]
MSLIKILAIVGSLRKDSYNRQLAMLAKEIVGDRAEFEILEYSDVPLLNQDIEFPPPEPVKRVREAAKAADGIWFFTPEYNHFFPGVLKNLIDWLSLPAGKERPVLIGKPAAISGTTTGMHATACAQDALVTLISYINMDVMNAPRLTIPYILEQVDEGGRVTLTKSRKYLERQADAFLAFVRKRVEDAEREAAKA